jgi:predicted transcriptional regulator
MANEVRDAERLLGLTVKIVAAFVSNNSVQATGLPELIARTHASLEALGTAPVPQQQPAIPAVPIRTSITAEHLVCLEDGKRFRSLKHHLISEHGMTPDQYRARWSLPTDYPMVAPNFAKVRSMIARTAGLGRKAGAT